MKNQQNVDLSECLPGLFLDALVPVESAIASAAICVPYVAMRTAAYVDEDHKRELLCAAQRVAAKHRSLLAKHRSTLEFIVPFMALTAAKVDHLLVLIDALQAEDGLAVEPLSAREAFAIGLMVLSPLVLVALIFILERRTK